MEKLGERIKAVRVHYKLSLSKFASKIDITKNSVVNYEGNSRYPNGETLEKIIRIFDIDANWLLAGKGTMFSPFKENGEIDYELLARMIYPEVSAWEIPRIARYLKGIRYPEVRSEFDFSLSLLPDKLEKLNIDRERIERIKAIQ
jgi:transcriptional regulator with XRE-family HTH domain